MKELVIKLRLDKGMADSAVLAHLEHLRKIKEAHLANAAAQRKADREASEAQKQLDREEAARKKQQADADRQALREAKAATKAAIAEQRSFEKEAAAERKAAEKVARNETRERAEADRKAGKESADASRLAAKAKVDAAKQAQKAWKEEADSHKDGLEMGVLGVGKMVAGYASLQVASKALTYFADMWRNQAEDIENSVDRLAKYRDAILELAALKGKLGQTTPEIADQLRFRANTLQTAQAAQTFQQGALNTGQAAMATGFIGKPEFDRLMQLSGSYQAATNGDPRAIGNLTGQMPGLIGTQNQNPDDVFRRQVGLLKIAEKGGSDPGVAMSQFSANSAYSKLKVFQSPEQQMAVQSQFSLSHTGDPGTKLDQFVRGTVGALGRTRVGKLEGADSQRNYITGLNGDATMDPLAIGRLIAKDIKDKQSADPKFSVLDYLTSKGYMDEEARMAVMEFSAGINSGEFDKTFGKMSLGQEIPSFADATTDMQKFKVSSVGRDRQNELAGHIADANVAMGPNEFYSQMKKLAFQRLRSRNEVSGEEKEWIDPTITNPFGYGKIVDETMAMMDEQLRKIGSTETLDPYRQGRYNESAALNLGGGFQSRMFVTDKTRAKLYAEYGQKIMDQGGNPMDLSTLIKAMETNTAATLKLEASMNKAAPAITPYRPAVPPPLPGPPIPVTR